MAIGEIVVTVTISLVSAGIGFAAAWLVMLYQFREAKRGLCIEMYQEFDSTDMLQSRFEADILVNEVRQMKSQVLLEELYDNPDTRLRYIQLARVLRFWERLSVMIINGRVDISLAKDVFSHDYKSWRDNYLQYCRSERYQLLNRVQRLDKYLLGETIHSLPDTF